MNKKHFAKFKIKDTVLKNELARAHGMIILLVMTLMSALVLFSSRSILLDPVMTLVAIVLLAIVGLLSLSVIISLYVKHK